MMRERGVSERQQLTLILLCEGLSETLEMEPLTAHLLEDPALSVERVPALCTHPAEVARARAAAAGRLVLVTCRAVRGDLEWDRRMRECDVDPLTTGFVRLDASSAADARRLIRAAVARALAVPAPGVADVVPRLMRLEGRVSRRGLLTVPPLRYQPVATVDAGVCAAASGCRLCADVCPLDALVGSTVGIEVNRTRCDACGICAAECPTDAITIPGDAPEQLEAEIGGLLELASAVGQRPRALLFRGRCGETRHTTTSKDWLVVEVPCGGALTPAVLLGSLALGASEVGMVSCDEDCRFGGAERVNAAVRYSCDLLDFLALAPERIRIVGSGDPSDSGLVPLPSRDVRPRDVLRSTADAILALAGMAVAAPGAFTHPESPLGLVEVDATTCTICGACALRCPTGALALQEGDHRTALTFDSTACTGCGLCMERCPELTRGAIVVSLVTDIAALRAGRRALIEDATVQCDRCGEPVGPRPMLARIEERLGPSTNPAMLAAITRRCLSCRGPGVPTPGGGSRS